MTATLTKANFSEFLKSNDEEFWTPALNVFLHKGTYGLGVTIFTGKNRVLTEKGAVNGFRDIPINTLFGMVKDELSRLRAQSKIYG